jgi:hypothetical protein
MNEPSIFYEAWDCREIKGEEIKKEFYALISNTVGKPSVKKYLKWKMS